MTNSMHDFPDHPHDPLLGKRPRCHGLQEADVEEDAGIEDLLCKRLKLEGGGASPNAAGHGDGSYPPLREEPKGVDKSAVCRVGIRMPDGRRACRSFWRLEPAKMMWSFCYSLLQEEERGRPFRLVVAIPGETRCLDFDSRMSFDESRLSNVIVSMVWE